MKKCPAFPSPACIGASDVITRMYIMYNVVTETARLIIGEVDYTRRELVRAK